MRTATRITNGLAVAVVAMGLGAGTVAQSYPVLQTWDFESGDLTGWANAGATVGTDQLFRSANNPVSHSRIGPKQGTWYVDGFQTMNAGSSDAHTGIIETDPFVLPAYAEFTMVSGGGTFTWSGTPQAPGTVAGIALEREVSPGTWENLIFQSGGGNSLVARTWDASAWAGETVRLRIYDNSTGGWGWTAVDNIVLTGLPLGAFSVPTVSGVTLPTAQVSAVTDTALDASRLLWDTEDKGTDDPADWTGSVSLGPQAAGATVSGQLTGLEADKVYTLRFYGEHGAETEWSIPVTINTDSTPPTLQSTVPADGATDASRHAALVATFDEPIALTGTGTVTIRNLTLGSDVTLTLPSARVSVAGSQLTIAPPAVLDGTTDYAVRISADAVRDLNANPFAGIADDTTWNFRTAAPVTGGRFEITPDKIVGTPTYPVVGTLHVVDWPSSMGSSISAPAGPDWPEDADDGFKLLSGGITPEGNRPGWEPDGTAVSAQRTGHVNHGVSTLRWTFALPNGAIIHNVYASFFHQRNSGTGNTYSYDEGTPITMARPDRGSVGNLVLKWTASDNTRVDVGFERIFEGPITVGGGDGFALTLTTGGGIVYIDAVVVDFTIPPPAGTVILVR